MLIKIKKLKFSGFLIKGSGVPEWESSDFIKDFAIQLVCVESVIEFFDFENEKFEYII